MKKNLLNTLPYNLWCVLTGYDQTFFRLWSESFLGTHEIFSFQKYLKCDIYLIMKIILLKVVVVMVPKP